MDANPTRTTSPALTSLVVKSAMIRLGIMVFLLLLAITEWLGLSGPELRFQPHRLELYTVFFSMGFGLNLGYLLFHNILFRHRYFFYAQLGLDFVLITVWILLTGGVFSVFLFIYILAIFFHGKSFQFKVIVTAVCSVCLVLLAISCVQFYFPQLWNETHIRGSDLAYNYSLFTVAAALMTTLVSVGKTEEKKLVSTVLEQQSALRRAEELRFQIFDWMDSALMTLDQDGLITAINKKALEWVPGNERHNVLNHFFGNFFPEFLPFWQEQEHWIANRSTVFSSTRQVVFGFKVTTLPEAHGWLVLFSDITEVRKLEKQVRDMEKMASIGALAAGLAHEMKNPLAGIKTSLQLLSAGDLDPKQAQRLSAVIVHDIDRLDFLLKDFLFFARPQTAVPEYLSVAAELEHVLSPLRLHNPQVDLQVKVREDPFFFDRNHFHQIMLNLCVNAFQALVDEPQPQIIITDQTHKDGRKISISDNGPGMLPQILEHCFDPFVTSKAKGSGLGLSIAQRLAVQNNAFLSVDSQESGTTISLTLNTRVVQGSLEQA